MGNLSANGLVDTGSTITILHTLKFQSLADELQHKLQSTPYTLKMAGGCPVPCLGAAHLSIQVGDKVWFKQYFILSKYTYNLQT